MDKENLFLTTFSIMLVFNIFYYSINNASIQFMDIAIYTGIALTVIGGTILTGVNIMGSGLSDVSIRVIFASLILLNVFFQFTLSGMTFGIGLSTNLFNAFATYDMLGLGFIVTSVLTLIAFISAMMIIIGV